MSLELKQPFGSQERKAGLLSLSARWRKGRSLPVPFLFTCSIPLRTLLPNRAVAFPPTNACKQRRDQWFFFSRSGLC